MAALWIEFKTLWKIALPLVAAYLAEFLMFLTSKLIIGKLGFEELAAVGISIDLSAELIIIMMAFLSVVGVLIGEADGGNRKKAAGHAAGQGLLVATFLGLIASVVIWNLPTILSWTGQDPVVVARSAPFAHHLAPFALAVTWFSVLRTFVTALSSTGIILFVSILAVFINYFLTVALVHGQFGFPTMGLAGAGLSLTIVNWLMLMLLAVYVYRHPRFQEYHLFPVSLQFDRAVCADIFKLGIAVAGLVTLEAGLFIAVSILSGILGTETLAAYQVIMGWVAIPFVISLGIANATLVRVAHEIGRGSPTAARRCGLIGIGTGVCVILSLTIVPLTVTEVFVGWYLNPADPGFHEVATLVAHLIVIVAFFQVFDGIQVISSHALRGLRDTIVPLWVATLGYWVIGIGGGSLLTFGLNYGVTGLWLGLAGGLTVTGTLLARRFWVLSARNIKSLKSNPLEPIGRI